MRIALTLIIAANVVFSPALAEETPESITECIRSNLPQHTSKKVIELRSRDRVGYEQVMQATLYWKRFDNGLSRALMYFHEPADIRNARLLTIEKPPANEMYIYMPGLFKVRRITSKRISSSVMGTDFSYEDFERLQGLLADARVTLRNENALVGDRPVYVLVSVMEPGSGYEKIVTYVDKESCLVLRSELYEPGGQLRKVMTVHSNDIFREGNIWVPRELLMRDIRDETETRLVLQELSVDIEIDDNMFDPEHLKGMARLSPGTSSGSSAPPAP